MLPFYADSPPPPQRVSDKMMHCAWKLDALTVKTGHWSLNKSQGPGGPGHNITMVGRQKPSLPDRGRATGRLQDGVGVREIARRLLWCGVNLPYANTVPEPPHGSSSVQQAQPLSSDHRDAAPRSAQAPAPIEQPVTSVQSKHQASTRSASSRQKHATEKMVSQHKTATPSNPPPTPNTQPPTPE